MATLMTTLMTRGYLRASGRGRGRIHVGIERGVVVQRVRGHGFSLTHRGEVRVERVLALIGRIRHAKNAWHRRDGRVLTAAHGRRAKTEPRLRIKVGLGGLLFYG